MYTVISDFLGVIYKYFFISWYVRIYEKLIITIIIEVKTEKRLIARNTETLLRGKKYLNYKLLITSNYIITSKVPCLAINKRKGKKKKKKSPH